MSDQPANQNQNQKPQSTQEEVNEVLQGVNYPASKEDLVKYAKEKGATGEVLETVEKLPDILYKTSNVLTGTLNKLLPLKELRDTLGKLL